MVTKAAHLSSRKNVRCALLSHVLSPAAEDSQSIFDSLSFYLLFRFKDVLLLYHAQKLSSGSGGFDQGGILPLKSMYSSKYVHKGMRFASQNLGGVGGPFGCLKPHLLQREASWLHIFACLLFWLVRTACTEKMTLLFYVGKSHRAYTCDNVDSSDGRP